MVHRVGLDHFAVRTDLHGPPLAKTQGVSQRDQLDGNARNCECGPTNIDMCEFIVNQIVNQIQTGMYMLTLMQNNTDLDVQTGGCVLG